VPQCPFYERKLLRLELPVILTIKRGFCCDIALLFHGTASKFSTALMFLITTNPLMC